MPVKRHLTTLYSQEPSLHGLVRPVHGPPPPPPVALTPNYGICVGFWALAVRPVSAIRLKVSRRLRLSIFLLLDSLLSYQSIKGLRERIILLLPARSGENRSLSLTLSLPLTVSSFSPPICPVCRRWGPRQRSTNMPHLGGGRRQSAVAKFWSF